MGFGKFLGGLIKGVGNLATGGLLGTGLEMLGGLGKAVSKNTPQQIQSQLTPEQKAILAARYKQLQAKAADQTGLNYVRKAGSIYDQSMGM
jgi:hypothetical protein